MFELTMFLILLFVYFLPAVVANARDHHNSLAIFFLNLLLGWTVLGWIAALIWALTATYPRRDVAPVTPATNLERHAALALGHRLAGDEPSPRPIPRWAR